MIGEMLRKPTKWSVMKQLILKDIEDLIIGSIGIVAFISFFVGGLLWVPWLGLYESAMGR